MAHYIIHDHDSEFDRADNELSAIAIASDRAAFLGPELGQYVRVTYHSVWGEYAEPELVGKPLTRDVDWREGRRQLMR